MELLKNTLDELMRQLDDKKAVFQEAGPQQWLKKALTKKELGHIRIKYFSKGILGLTVDSSAWLYILSLKKDTLLETLKKENPELKNIHFRIGEIAD
ncbi:MAG TPA: DciA family protein [Candidatus Omnitrophota bacterium]|nr:DciA family protein [Candidatus Omnitrophota bacterium]HPT39765.1 DciA family protein [Candidatus Omnitrophota bacterium]